MLASALQTAPSNSAPFAKRSLAPSPSPDRLTQYLVRGSVKNFQAKQHVFHSGDIASHVFKVETGCLCIYRLTASGRRQVINFAYAGDLVGLGAVEVHDANAEALTLSRIRSIPVSTLYQCAQNDAQLSLKLFDCVSHDLRATRQMLSRLNQRSAVERVAAFLVDLSRRNERNGGDGRRLVLPMARSDIADFLGLTIETVSRTLTKFRASGLIDIKQCAIVRIIDSVALNRLSGGAFD